MHRKPLVVAVACFWLGTLALAYLIGRSGSQPNPGAERGRDAAEASARPRLSALGDDPSNGGETSATVELGARRRGSDDALTLLKSSLANPNPVERMAAFMQALAGLGADDFEAALEGLEDDLRGGESRREIGLLLYAWAEKDGAAALRHLDGLSLGRDGYSLYGSALTAWGENDPAAAEAWALKKHEGKDNNNNNYG